MKDEELKWVLENLTPDQEAMIEHYCKNDLALLKKVGKSVWNSLNIPQAEYDELYDDAVIVLIESLALYDPMTKIKFSTYLYGNINRSAKQWFRDNYLRGVRSHLLIKDGKIVRDEKKRPIIIHPVSIDERDEDGRDLSEMIPDKNTNVESSVFDNLDVKEGSPLDRYLRKLPIDQRKVARLFAAGYTAKEIKESLHISNKAFSNIMAGLRAYENVSILRNKKEKE